MKHLVSPFFISLLFTVGCATSEPRSDGSAQDSTSVGATSGGERTEASQCPVAPPTDGTPCTQPAGRYCQYETAARAAAGATPPASTAYNVFHCEAGSWLSFYSPPGEPPVPPAD